MLVSCCSRLALAKRARGDNVLFSSEISCVSLSDAGGVACHVFLAGFGGLCVCVCVCVCVCARICVCVCVLEGEGELYIKYEQLSTKCCREQKKVKNWEEGI